MHKRILFAALVVFLCVPISATAFAVQTRQASGRCSMSSAGRNVSYGGFCSSAQIEDVIAITAILWEKQGSTWIEIDREYKELDNSDYVSVSGAMTVDGGHYYKATGIHYSKKDGRAYSVTSETAQKWIP